MNNTRNLKKYKSKRNTKKQQNKNTIIGGGEKVNCGKLQNYLNSIISNNTLFNKNNNELFKDDRTNNDIINFFKDKNIKISKNDFIDCSNDLLKIHENDEIKRKRLESFKKNIDNLNLPTLIMENPNVESSQVTSTTTQMPLVGMQHPFVPTEQTPMPSVGMQSSFVPTEQTPMPSVGMQPPVVPTEQTPMPSVGMQSSFVPTEQTLMPPVGMQPPVVPTEQTPMPPVGMQPPVVPTEQTPVINRDLSNIINNQGVPGMQIKSFDIVDQKQNHLQTIQENIEETLKKINIVLSTSIDNGLIKLNLTDNNPFNMLNLNIFNNVELFNKQLINKINESINFFKINTLNIGNQVNTSFNEIIKNINTNEYKIFISKFIEYLNFKKYIYDLTYKTVENYNKDNIIDIIYNNIKSLYQTYSSNKNNIYTDPLILDINEKIKKEYDQLFSISRIGNRQLTNDEILFKKNIINFYIEFYYTYINNLILLFINNKLSTIANIQNLLLPFSSFHTETLESILRTYVHQPARVGGKKSNKSSNNINQLLQNTVNSVTEKINNKNNLMRKLNNMRKTQKV